MKKLSFVFVVVSILGCSHSPGVSVHRDPAGFTPVIPEGGLPLYEMMGLKVIVKSGDISRAPLGRHYAPHELATERSQPVSDPSLVLGYHFELAELRKQKSVAKHDLMQRMMSKPRFLKVSPSHWFAPDYEQAIEKNPDLVKYWETHRGRYAPGKMTPENGPTLVNSDYEYKNISDREFGYCWGFATFNRFFTQLAFFSPENPPGIPAYEWGGLAKNEVWFRYYEKKIDSILNGNAELIPGFANFRAFTLVPEIEFYIKLRAMNLWAHRAISMNTLHTFFTSTRVMKDREIADLLADLKTRTDRGELPKIMFTAKNSHKVFGGSADVHVVLVNGVELNPDGSGKILLWDINFYAEDYIKSPKFIEVRAVPGKDRELHYGPWIEKEPTPQLTYESSQLGQVKRTPEDSKEENEMIHSLHAFCTDPETGRYCR